MDVVNEWGALACNCQAKKACKRVIKGGAINYGEQCTNCGRFENKGKSHFGLSFLPNELMDESIQAAFRKRCEAHRQKQVAEQQAERDAKWQQRQKFYEEYIASPLWLSRREAALKRDRHLCQGCLSRRATQVHHLTYEHLGNELLWELASVCLDCHKKIHPHMRDVEIDWDNFK